MMRTPTIPWLSPVGSCPFCERYLTRLSHFVDGRTARGWTLMCRSCHKDRGFGLGIGNGQLYKFNEEDATFYKI